MPCHHNLENYLHEYLEQIGIAADPKIPGRATNPDDGLAPGGSAAALHSRLRILIHNQNQVIQGLNEISFRGNAWDIMSLSVACSSQTLPVSGAEIR